MPDLVGGRKTLLSPLRLPVPPRPRRRSFQCAPDHPSSRIELCPVEAGGATAVTRPSHAKLISLIARTTGRDESKRGGRRACTHTERQAAFATTSRRPVPAMRSSRSCGACREFASEANVIASARSSPTKTTPPSSAGTSSPVSKTAHVQVGSCTAINRFMDATSSPAWRERRGAVPRPAGIYQSGIHDPACKLKGTEAAMCRSSAAKLLEGFMDRSVREARWILAPILAWASHA